MKKKYSLIGVDGNAFAVMGYVARCMEREGLSRTEIKEYQANATSGDYNNLLCVSAEMIDKLNNM